MNSGLQFAVFTSPPVLERETPGVPFGHPATSSPMNTTLIYGTREAILVDPPWHLAAVEDAIKWVQSFTSRLNLIYITHGHGDHWLGASAVQSQFPHAMVSATRQTRDYMYRYSRLRGELWDKRFPGQVASGSIIVRPSTSDLLLEGASVQVLELGHTDTDDTTALWIPSIRLIVAGDSVYNRCHLALNEVRDGGAAQWLAALDNLDRLQPEYVVAGHAAPDVDHSPDAIEETRRYITDYTRALELGLPAKQLFAYMLGRYPEHVNPKALWRSITATAAP
ncbi:MBL fold metallo-hydrolase [Paenarthrobacter sp. NPDC089316]|uniref:MBL fold metallo-hydrolase n=1 Tax=unclassified Paenarthrobacter TaxID=2634190 RepID=UPI003448DA8B